jgi:hypothetical protein
MLDTARKLEWRSRHRAAANARRRSWLELGLQQLGLEPRADFARQRECISAFESKVAATLRTAVWMHWLHSHTQGRYARAVDEYYSAAYVDDPCDSDSDEYLMGYGGSRGRGRCIGMSYFATKSVQSRPEFQMPLTIPWLPAPGNNTDEALREAARAVRAYVRWGRAFLRVRAIVAPCRPSSAFPTAHERSTSRRRMRADKSAYLAGWQLRSALLKCDSFAVHLRACAKTGRLARPALALLRRCEARV